MPRLSEILSKMNDEVKVQFLQESTVSVKDKKRTADTEITFATSEVSCNDFYRSDKTGIVIWLSRDKYNMAVQELSSKEQKDAE